MANYIKNQDLLREIIASKEQKKLTNKAISYISLMIEKIRFEFRYKDPIDVEDCKAEAMLNVLNYWSDFDENKSKNAFAYFSQTIKTGFAIGYNRLHKKSFKTISLNNLKNIQNI